jgi:hypothetical protein
MTNTKELKPCPYKPEDGMCEMQGGCACQSSVYRAELKIKSCDIPEYDDIIALIVKAMQQCDRVEGEGGGSQIDYARAIYAKLEVHGLLRAATQQPEVISWQELHAKIRKARDEYEKEHGSVMGFNDWIYVCREYPFGLKIVEG